MSTIKIDVLWSPNHENKFLTFGTDLNLYKIEPGPLPTSKSQGGLKLSEDSHATLLSVNSDHQYMKCFAWYPKREPDHLLAIGLANGRLVLTSFGKGGSADPYSLVGKEFVPKHARQCNYVAWNPVECNIIAAGLEKYRADYSILIWDVNSRSQSDFFTSSDKKSSSVSESSYSRPLVELGPSETTLSLAWFSKEPKTLVTGMNNKYLRIFDLRDTSRPQSVSYTKAVYGVKVDPHCEHRLASYYENQLSIWDTRNFDKPVLTKPESKPISKMAWSPTRNGLLACLTKDSSVVKLYDIQNTSLGSDELEPGFLERIIQPTSQQHHLSSFDWHPTHENRLVSVSMAGAVKDMTIFERIALDWSPDIYFTWACGRQIKQCHSIKLCEEANDDISIKMKRRAQKGYGLKESLEQNATIVWDDNQLRDLWFWIQALKENSHQQDSNQASPVALVPSQRISITARPVCKQYLGVKAVVCDASNSDGVKLDYWTWQGLENTDNFKFRPQRKVFKSEERKRALDLCGWGFDKEAPTLPVIDKFENEREFEKAAAISIFTLKLKRAIQVLSSGAKINNHETETDLHMIAMALAGFSEEKKSLWKEMCGNLHSRLKNPYLRAMFAFMTAEGDDYDEILNEKGMNVVDRTAFACLYLNDKKLQDYLQTLTQQLIEEGNLNGILLTGLTGDAIDLLQQYVDVTGDIQTASLTIIQSFPNPELSKDIRVTEWIECYRSTLDRWSLWYQRAEFDVYRNKCDMTTPRSQAQVFVSCTYCGKAISYNSVATRNRHFMFGGAAALKSKVSSCPSCRKPLPRCALCLINMGTAAGSGKPGFRNKEHTVSDDEPGKLTQFKDWFTWCQSCRHGGHAEHMTQWYGERNECPVTGCTCKCASLDMSSMSLEDH